MIDMKHVWAKRSSAKNPNPGSNAALAAGCNCPVLDNGHGKGAYGGARGDDGKPVFWISEECAIHGRGKA